MRMKLAAWKILNELPDSYPRHAISGRHGAWQVGSVKNPPSCVRQHYRGLALIRPRHLGSSILDIFPAEEEDDDSTYAAWSNPAGPRSWYGRFAVTAQVVPRAKLGGLTKIDQGGQGVVYGAPTVNTKFADSMVYTEYRAHTRAEIDFTALAAMPTLVEEALPHVQAERLVSIAARPGALVEENGTPTGFVTPATPDGFVVNLRTAKGVASSTAEFQHLLNHFSVLAARGIDIDEPQGYSLPHEVASGLAFLHRHGVCVGDISPKNLLFHVEPQAAVFLHRLRRRAHRLRLGIAPDGNPRLERHLR